MLQYVCGVHSSSGTSLVSACAWPPSISVSQFDRQQPFIQHSTERLTAAEAPHTSRGYSFHILHIMLPCLRMLSGKPAGAIAKVRHTCQRTACYVMTPRTLTMTTTYCFIKNFVSSGAARRRSCAKRASVVRFCPSPQLRLSQASVHARYHRSS